MQDLVAADAFGGAEVGADGEGEWDECGEHDVVVGDAEDGGQFVFQRGLRGGPDGAEAALAGGELTVSSTFSIDRTQWGMTYGRGKIDDMVKLAVQVKAK